MNKKIKHWILLPGLDGSGFLFNDFIKKYHTLDSNLKLEVISLPNSPLSYEELINYIVEKLPEEDDYGLLGESFSGPIAIHIASRNMKNLKALCLVATFAKTPHWSYSYLSQIIKYIPKLLTLTKKVGHIILSNSFNKNQQLNLQHSLTQINEETFKSRLMAVSHINYESLLEKIKVPTIIINAKKDLIVDKKVALKLNKIKKSRTYWIDAPHFILQTKAKEVIDLLTNVHYL